MVLVRWMIWLLVGVVGAAMVGGCQSEDESLDREVSEGEGRSDDEETDSSEEHEEVGELFGIPVPSNYVTLRMGEGEAQVVVEKSLEELKAFFQREAVDYEVIERPPRHLALVPLRSGMGGLEARRLRSRDIPVELRYREEMPQLGEYQEQQQEVEERRRQTAEVSGEEIVRQRQRQARFMRQSRVQFIERNRGEPVELETEDGELLAPGARWGEPYTPPEGSPLDDERYRANFGRPFGEWSAH